MQQIINFIIRYKTSLLYVLLLIISFIFTIRSRTYHHSKFFNSSNWITGNIYKTATNITSYFSLETENKELVEENKRLRKLLFNIKSPNSVTIDTTTLTYTVVPAKIIKNSYNNTKNYITIDKGDNLGITQDMGVITGKGILGIVENTSHQFSRVQSILNTKSIINAKIKHSNNFGSLIWEKTDTYNVVQLTDIPRLAELHIGDTVVTGAMSSIFPENIPIGTIKKFDLNSSKSFYNIDVALFNNMTNIKNVYIIDNLNRVEIQKLESETEK